MAFETIRLETVSRVRHIVLNRPHKRNAINAAMWDELMAAMEEAESDADVGAVILRGEGPSFCSGADLSPSPDSEPGASSFRAGLDGLSGLGERVRKIWNLRKPTIAQVHGFCLGEGTDIAFHCDLVMAAEDAQIGYPPVRALGSPPTHMWTFLAGPQWAKRMLLTGDQIDGKTAERAGLVLEAFPADQLSEEVQSVASRMAKVPYEISVQNKSICNKAVELMGFTLLQELARESDAMAHQSPHLEEFTRMASDQGLKAALAWLNKSFE